MAELPIQSELRLMNSGKCKSRHPVQALAIEQYLGEYKI